MGVMSSDLLKSLKTGGNVLPWMPWNEDTSNLQNFTWSLEVYVGGLHCLFWVPEKIRLKLWNNCCSKIQRMESPINSI